MGAEQLEIRRLRARLPPGSSGDHTIALRLRVERLMASADLRPAQLPPSSILIVRRLEDPLPGHFADPDAFRIDAGWEQAARGRLSAFYEQAARPARGELGIDAPAVLFTDEAEMLACLAWALARGEAHSRWWWRVLLRRFPGTAATSLRALLHAHGQLIPAIFHHLAIQEQIEGVLEVLPVTTVVELVQRMQEAFSLPDLSAPPTAGPGLEGRPGGPPETIVHAGAPVDGAHHAGAASGPGWYRAAGAPMPWRLTEALRVLPRALDATRRLVLELALVLHNAPSIVRTPLIVEAFRRQWRRRADAHLSRDEDTQADREATSRRESARVSHLEEPHTRALPHEVRHEEPQPQVKPVETVPPAPSAAYPPVQERTAASHTERAPTSTLPSSEEGVPAPSSTPTPTADPVLTRLDPRPPGTPETSRPATTPATPTPAGQEPATPPQPSRRRWLEPILWLEEGIDTRLGGALFLTNLMRQLDLPASFEAGWGLGSLMGPWGTLEALARGLALDLEDTLEADPVWTALAALDGREAGTLPGEALRGSDRFRLPPRWFGTPVMPVPSSFQWRVCGGRLQIFAGPDLLVVDRPLEGMNPEEQAMAALRGWLSAIETGGPSPVPSVAAEPTLEPRPSDTASFGTLDSTPLACDLPPGLLPSGLSGWVSRTLPFVRRYLGTLLGCPASIPEAPARLLLRQSARLYVTSTHVDLVMRMRDIALPIRLGGLDLNPGWSPLFGRVIQFHYQ